VGALEHGVKQLGRSLAVVMGIEGEDEV